MQRRSLVLAALLAAPLVPVASASAAAPVTGTLDKSGYTVVAIATGNGKAVTAIHAGRKFRVKSPASKMTLQLINAKGRYAGTVVVGTKGTKAIVGVRAGAKLGTVRIKSGYATPAKKLAARYVDSTRTATARKGVPVGARGFGLVARSGAKETAREAQAPAPQPQPGPGPAPAPGPGGGATGPDTTKAGADPDKDGVPSAMDIDANGNGVIDQVDPNAPVVTGVRSFSNLFVDLDKTVNINAMPGSAAGIDEMMVRDQNLVFLDVPTGASLDCNGLTWCSPGGTGQIQPASAGNRYEPGGATTPFPDCCLQPGGFGLISGTSQGTDSREFRIFPRATSTALRSGDTLTMRVPEGSGVKEIPGAIGFVFNTVPAVQSWSAGSRGGAIAYPVAANGEGTQGNPFTIDSTSLAITLRFWRPQRSSITTAGEPAGFMDIGNLRYLIQLPDAPGATGGGMVQCPASTLSTSDPNLRIEERGPEAFARDLQGDQPANAANLLTMTVDAGKCIAAKGGSTAPGGRFRIHLEGMTPSGGDHANQNLFFRIA